jgi:hypothetical protein
MARDDEKVPRARANALVDVERYVESFRAIGSRALAKEFRRPGDRRPDLLGALVDLPKDALVVPDARFVALVAHTFVGSAHFVAFSCALRDALSGRVSPC